MPGADPLHSRDAGENDRRDSESEQETPEWTALEGAPAKVARQTGIRRPRDCRCAGEGGEASPAHANETRRHGHGRASAGDEARAEDQHATVTLQCPLGP